MNDLSERQRAYAELHDALLALRDEILRTLRIPQLVDWLARHLPD